MGYLLINTSFINSHAKNAEKNAALIQGGISLYKKDRFIRCDKSAFGADSRT